MKRLKPLFVPASAVVLAAILNTFVLVNAHVPSGSMEPAIPSGSMVIGNRLAYRTEEPAAGDVIIFRHRETGENWLIKRVVAIPGQMFAVRQGRVYIDGQLLDEPYLPEEMYLPFASTMQQTHWEVPEGSIFVMGDNRNNSTDSRDDQLGTIDTGYVLGKAVLALWPMDRFGTV